MKTLLHVGCGSRTIQSTTPGFNDGGWSEIRLDIDPGARPDLLGTMTDLSVLEDGSVDAVFSSHNIEHLYAHEVPVALREFLRVLGPGGFVVLTCPDLRSVCELVVQDRLLEPAYSVPAGPVTPHDILYGYSPLLARGQLFMAHKCGFTESTLREAFMGAGFAAAVTMTHRVDFALGAIASKEPMAEEAMKALAHLHFPGLARGAGPTGWV